MKVVCKVSDNATFELDAADQKEAMEEMAKLHEVFGNDTCGKCKGTDIRPVVREVEENKYYEFRCQNSDCRARLSFGVHKKGGTLFPKRKDDDGNWRGSNGWVRWNPQTKSEE